MGIGEFHSRISLATWLRRSFVPKRRAWEALFLGRGCPECPGAKKSHWRPWYLKTWKKGWTKMVKLVVVGGCWKLGILIEGLFYFIFILDIIKDNFMTCGFWLMFVFFKFCHEMLWKKTDCRTVVHSFQKDACKLTYPPGNPASICWNVHFWRCWFSKELPMNGGSHV